MTTFPSLVPTDEMLRRVDLLAKLGTSIITQSGGELLLASPTWTGLSRAFATTDAWPA